MGTQINYRKPKMQMGKITNYQKAIFICFILLFQISFIQAQNETATYPQVGDQFNDHIFSDLVNSSEKIIDTKNLRGKWLVLDFWGQGCASCIASMPKINKLSKDFGDRAKVMMVAMYNNNGRKPSGQEVVKDIFTRLVKRHRFSFCSAFDSLVQQKYNIRFVPHIFIINPEGKIVAKAESVDSTILAGFINGVSPKYKKAYSADENREPTYNRALPLYTKGEAANGGIDTAVWCRSILTKWNENLPQYVFDGFNSPADNDPKIVWAQAIGFSLRELFLIGYFGNPGWSDSDSLYAKISQKPILEVKDPRPFDFATPGVIKTGENAYAYSLKLPTERASYQNARKMLLSDLHNYLGYQSSLENRTVPVLKLIIADSIKLKKLKTKGAAFAIKRPRAQNAKQFDIFPDSSVLIWNKDGIGLRLYNYPFEKVYNTIGLATSQAIKNYSAGKFGRPAIINATGLDWRVDIDIDADTKDWDACLSVLRKYGLDIVNGEIEMQCIIIRDAEPIKNTNL